MIQVLIDFVWLFLTLFVIFVVVLVLGREAVDIVRWLMFRLFGPLRPEPASPSPERLPGCSWPNCPHSCYARGRERRCRALPE